MIERFGQESTWRGFITVASALGVVISPDLAEQIIATGLALVGLINILKND